MVKKLKALFTEKSCKRHQNIYRIEKIIRKRQDKALVKWKGYPDQFNSWIPLKDLEKII